MGMSPGEGGVVCGVYVYVYAWGGGVVSLDPNPLGLATARP